VLCRRGYFFPASEGEREILEDMTIFMASPAYEGNTFIIQNLSSSAPPVCHLELFLQPSPDVEGNKDTSHKHLPRLFKGHIHI
jgi:hypothetical protein